LLPAPRTSHPHRPSPTRSESRAPPPLPSTGNCLPLRLVLNPLLVANLAPPASRPQTATRPIPSPAFNQDVRQTDVAPLQNRQSPALDDSCVVSLLSCFFLVPGCLHSLDSSA
jgi:hypothetical protein